MKPLDDLADVLSRLPPAACIAVHSGAAHPTQLAEHLAGAAARLQGRRVLTLMPLGPLPYAQAPARDHLCLETFLPGAGLRAAMDAGRLRPHRLALSEVPPRLRSGDLAVGAVLLRVSPPDAAGHVHLGVSVDCMPAAIEQAQLVVAEIDPRMPRTAGPGWLPASRIDAWVEARDGPHESSAATPDAVEEAIAGHVASLIGDGDVLQLGVGALPDQVLHRLGHLRHLGLHTGIVGPAARGLIERGVIDNSTKGVLPGVGVATMALGDAGFYAWLDGNAAIELHPCELTHSAATLRQLGPLCAVNAALQVDLQARFNVEWAGARRVSLPGGLLDFARAAASLPRGRSIIALRSTSRQGDSNIVARLTGDAPAALGPGEVDFCVTEFGVASLRGATPEQARRALAAIAHPRHRDALLHAARE